MSLSENDVYIKRSCSENFEEEMPQNRKILIQFWTYESMGGASPTYRWLSPLGVPRTIRNAKDVDILTKDLNLMNFGNIYLGQRTFEYLNWGNLSPVGTLAFYISPPLPPTNYSSPIPPTSYLLKWMGVGFYVNGGVGVEMGVRYKQHSSAVL